MMEPFSLAKYVKDEFDGMFVFSDVHGEYDSFIRAYEFARSENYFFMSMGDLVDRGDKPYEVVTKMAEVVYDGRGGIVVGNHDDKFRRYHRGSKVSFSMDSKATLASVGADRKEVFLETYSRMLEDPMMAGMYFTFDDIILVHAASHPCMWESTGRFGDTAKSRALYGETNGEKYDDGYPVRLYNWVDEIPTGRTVMVGHDRMPVFNVPITEPMVKTNSNGGKAIFIDTGCGKGGFLTGAVILHDKKKFVIDSYKEFK
jgi:calcineurin-like phosphoesterase family protein